MATLAVRMGGKIHEVPVGAGRTLLDACEDAGLNVPFGCREGKCGMCLAVCLDGAVRSSAPFDADENQPAGLADRRHIRPCSSLPATERVEISYDLEGETPQDGARFEPLTSLLYGLFAVTLMFPVVIELVAVPMFAGALLFDNPVLRTLLGGLVVMTSFILAPTIHIAEALIFRLKPRSALLGNVSIGSTLKAPLVYFPAAVILWIGIEYAISKSSGIYTTPSPWDVFLFLTVIQITNLFVMDLVFWLVHGPFGLHHPKVFRHLHAKHHRQRMATFSTGPDLSSIDMLVEVGVFTFVPILCGFAFGFVSVEFILCSLINSLMTSTWAHSPYEITKIMPQFSVTQYLTLPFRFLIANPHQGHHAKVEANYSIWGFWDKVFGTFQDLSVKESLRAQYVHDMQLKRPSTTALFYPVKSAWPVVELAATIAACAALWMVMGAVGLRPVVAWESMVLPL